MKQESGTLYLAHWPHKLIHTQMNIILNRMETDHGLGDSQPIDCIKRDAVEVKGLSQRRLFLRWLDCIKRDAVEVKGLSQRRLFLRWLDCIKRDAVEVKGLSLRRLFLRWLDCIKRDAVK